VRIVASGVSTPISACVRLTPFPLPGGPRARGRQASSRRSAATMTDLAVGDPVSSLRVLRGVSDVPHGHPVYCETWAPLNLLAARGRMAAPRSRFDGMPLHGTSSGSPRSRRSGRQGTERREGAGGHAARAAGPLACGMQTAPGIVNVLPPPPATRSSCSGGRSVERRDAGTTSPGDVIAVDVNRRRLELAERLGATHHLNALDRPGRAVML